MTEIYIELVFDYGVLIASAISFIFFLSLLLKPKQKSSQIFAFILLLLTSLISLEFYPYQVSSFPLSIIIPIGILSLFFIKFFKIEYPRLIGLMIILFSLYMVLGLVFLSSSANTWGSGPAPNGIFIVSNCIVILVTLFSMQQKYFNLFLMCQMLIALAGFTLIYYSTNGFYYNDYDGQDVRFRRISSVLVCVISIFNCFLIKAHKKYLLPNNNPFM